MILNTFCIKLCEGINYDDQTTAKVYVAPPGKTILKKTFFFSRNK